MCSQLIDEVALLFSLLEFELCYEFKLLLVTIFICHLNFL
jgi:hypothetical protein